jgi:hypothetical protein
MIPTSFVEDHSRFIDTEIANLKRYTERPDKKIGYIKSQEGKIQNLVAIHNEMVAHLNAVEVSHPKAWKKVESFLKLASEDPMIRQLVVEIPIKDTGHTSYISLDFDENL